MNIPQRATDDVGPAIGRLILRRMDTPWWHVWARVRMRIAIEEFNILHKEQVGRSLSRSKALAVEVGDTVVFDELERLERLCP